MRKDMVWIAISKDMNGVKHYRVYESLEDAKEKQPSSLKCRAQIVRSDSRSELKDLAEFACWLMGDSKYSNADKLLEDYFKYKQEHETFHHLSEKENFEL